MEFKREIEIKSEMESFNDKFLHSGKKYAVEWTAAGQITKLKTTDKDIIKFAKELGLKQ